jgi:hypothetical protein
MYECECLFIVIDNFGLGMDEKWFLPGVKAQWVLQHLKNGYCCNGKAFHPVINHKIEFHHSFTFCK